MIQIREAIIVEGRYDINTVKQLVDTIVLETGGFRIFKEKERLSMFRRIAQKRGVLILTDSDGAGLVIRNYLKGAIDPKLVKHAYIPEIAGKESRKRRASKAGTLGVEGMSQEVLLRALQRANATILGQAAEANPLNDHRLQKADLYEMQLSGSSNSAVRRKKLLKALDLPENLSANALLDYLNAVSDRNEVLEILQKI